jgi:dTDP-4-amino-4,6-dideoxygalactose transaminase
MTSGEGGMISAADETIARNARLLRNQGMERQYENEVIGFNARMTDIHAAIGRVQLTKVDAWTQTRRQNAAFLDAHLSGVVVPPVAPGAVHVYHQYTIRVPEDRDGFVTALKEEYAVGSGVYYPVPNHRLPSLTHFAPGLDLPETEKAAAEVVSLPVHPSLSQDDLGRIVEAVNAVAKAGA